MGPGELDRLWVLVSAALIFFMQAGFLCLEVGFVRPKNVVVTAMKNVVDWTIVSIIWMLVGFGIAFGHSLRGLIGIDLFFLDGVAAPNGNGLGWTFFLFQLGFAGTSATIVSGAMAERVSFFTYIILTTANALIIYPVVSHWVWGNSFFTDQHSWLTALGFHDFAGSTAVHSVGGWISIVAIVMLGPRLGRFGADGKVRPMESYSLPFVALGVFILWVGWWGFNGGSTLRAGEAAALVIVKTNLAGSVAGLVAYLHGRWFQRKIDLEGKFLGGILAGLVAITACSHVVSLPSAAAIGVLAGIAHNYSYILLMRLQIDDPVGAVPVHLVGGVLGTICVGLFGNLEKLSVVTGVHNTRLGQIGAQLAGVASVGVWTAGLAYLTCKILRATVGLRTSPQEEADGLTMSGEPREHVGEELDPDQVRKLLGGGE
jgi:ammonium transporter, Amt family